MYHDKHAIAEINEITNSTTNAKIVNNPKTPDKDLQNKTQQKSARTIWLTNQDQTHNGPTNIQTTELIRYPPISLIRPPIVTQQIWAVFQLSQEAWNKLSNQMKRWLKQTNYFKKAVKSTYQKLTNIPKQYNTKVPNHLKTHENIGKKAKFVANSSKDGKDTNKTLKGKNTQN